jgi:hypothetical protein
MASPKISCTFITPLEYENGRMARAEAATTASVPVYPVTACKPPRRFSAPVGVVSKLKKREPLATSSHDSTLHNARVTIPVFPIGCLPTTIIVVYEHSFFHLIFYFRHPLLAFSPQVLPLRNIPIFQPPAHPTLILVD